MHDAYADTSLGRLHCKEHEADGPCVLFIHGLAASTLSFKRLVGELPESMHVCLLDMLGHGLSDAPRVEYTLETHARAAAEFTRLKKLEPCCVFGHSYGALVAATLLKHGIQAKGLVIEDPAGLGERSNDSQALEVYEERLVREALELNPREYVVRSMVHSVVTGANEIAPMLKGAGVPVMVIWGSNDNELAGQGNVSGAEYARRLSNSVRGSRFELIRGAGHTPHYTNAKEISALLSGFVGIRG